jgi:signal transduction histidine kinase/DNA-binding response OmpR family regulator
VTDYKGDILAVDDTPASLKLLTDTLRAEGYKVRAAPSGELALDAAISAPPELALLDINMPGMNGFEVCRRLKAQPETRDTPIIFVSALSETEEKVVGFELGAVDYVTKPYQREELLARVRTHLELHRLRQQFKRMVDERTADLCASEKALARSNRELRALSNCNKVLVRAADEQALLDDVCRIVCKEAGYRMAWVGYAENDPARTVRPAAWAGFEDGYLATADITWADTERGCGPDGMAIRSGATSCIQDFADAPQAAFLRDSALRRGYRSCISLPLKDEAANAFGVLAIYASEPNAFTADETRLLEELAGDLAFGVIALRDRSERKLAEEKIIKLNQDLEKRVANRTAQLEAANKDLESFSYSVSHDLRAPLRAIDGFSNILLEDYSGVLDANGQRYLGLVRQGVGRMGRLIDDILAFSRTSRSEMGMEMVEMADITREVFAELRAMAPERNINLVFGDKDLGDQDLGELPSARCDRAMIRQVLSNLLHNAIKYTSPRSDAVIEVSGMAGEAETCYCVKDNGVGFDMDYADKLFGVFQRLHSAGEFEGTGIGLAIVKRIIERHGGRVWAEGKVGEGAAFHFSLPNTQ